MLSLYIELYHASSVMFPIYHCRLCGDAFAPPHSINVILIFFFIKVLKLEKSSSWKVQSEALYQTQSCDLVSQSWNLPTYCFHRTRNAHRKCHLLVTSGLQWRECRNFSQWRKIIRASRIWSNSRSDPISVRRCYHLWLYSKLCVHSNVHRIVI